MPQYQYQGFNASGKSVKGSINADNLGAAKSNLKKDGIFPSEIKEALVGTGEKAGSSSNLPDVSNLFNRISTEDIALMTRQLATLVASHIPLVEALDALTDQVENDKLKAAISRVKADVNEGSNLHKALAKLPNVFSDLYVSMIESGETSGALDVVAVRLADFLEYQDRLQKRVSGAMIYPMVMIIVAVAVLLFIFTFVIPKIEVAFESANATLPLITQIVLAMSRFTLSYWWAMLFGTAAVIFLIRKYLQSPTGKRKWDDLQLRIPVAGDLVRMVAISRFTKTLSTLLKSGIPLLSSLNVVKNVVGNITIREAIESASTNLTEGQSISKPLMASGQFPPLVTHMISIGEKTGELEQMLEKVAEHYEYQVDTRINAFTSLIQPLMIILLAGVAGTIVVSVVLPILELNELAL